jgi:hypothetical protein
MAGTAISMAFRFGFYKSPATLGVGVAGARTSERDLEPPDPQAAGGYLTVMVPRIPRAM